MVGAWRRDAGRDHVAVADGLDLLQSVLLHERVEVAEEAVEHAHELFWRPTLHLRREVDHVGEEDRRLAEPIGDRPRLFLELFTIGRGRMLSSRFSDFSCSVRSAAKRPAAA